MTVVVIIKTFPRGKSMKEIEKSIIKETRDKKEFIPSPKFIAQVKRLVLENREKIRKNKNFIAKSPRIGIEGDYITQ